MLDRRTLRQVNKRLLAAIPIARPCAPLSNETEDARKAEYTMDERKIVSKLGQTQNQK
jgi:hypothetical protein